MPGPQVEDFYNNHIQRQARWSVRKYSVERVATHEAVLEDDCLGICTARGSLASVPQGLCF
jgi:hypothetical protein